MVFARHMTLNVAFLALLVRFLVGDLGGLDQVLGVAMRHSHLGAEQEQADENHQEEGQATLGWTRW